MLAKVLWRTTETFGMVAPSQSVSYKNDVDNVIPRVSTAGKDMQGVHYIIKVGMGIDVIIWDRNGTRPSFAEHVVDDLWIFSWEGGD